MSRVSVSLYLQSGDHRPTRDGRHGRQGLPWRHCRGPLGYVEPSSGYVEASSGYRTTGLQGSRTPGLQGPGTLGLQGPWVVGSQGTTAPGSLGPVGPGPMPPTGKIDFPWRKPINKKYSRKNIRHQFRPNRKERICLTNFLPFFCPEMKTNIGPKIFRGPSPDPPGPPRTYPESPRTDPKSTPKPA